MKRWVPASLRSVLVPLVVGFVISTALYLLGGEVTLRYDELAYVARADNFLHRSGYAGFLFAPGYSFVIAIFQSIFDSWVEWLRFFQIICSCVTGYFVTRISGLVFGEWTAVLSGYVWACYLPLAMYSHSLWPEALFLFFFVPAVYALLLAKQELTPRRRRFLLMTAGVALGLAACLKESVVFFPLVCAGWLVLARPRLRWDAMWFLVPVAIALVSVAAWHRHRYGEFMLTGGTLPVNLDVGLNGEYGNSDYNTIGALYQKAGKDFSVHVNRTFADYGPGWPSKEDGTVSERTIWNLECALSYAADHKGRFVLTRIKKLADLYSPLSFMVRDVAFAYDGPLSGRALRRPVVVIALLSTVLVLLFGWLGLLNLRGQPAVALFACVIGYFTATGLINAMSRIRVPMEPFFIVLASGFIFSRRRVPETLRGRLAFALVPLILASLWAINRGEISDVVKLAWLREDYVVSD
jgi:dolichyl-phosphate-mannose-protein mannosyltransferase